jgi:Zn-dependent alcohol dehydrogenase
MRFRAAVLRRVGEPLRIEAVDVETLAPGDVLIVLGQISGSPRNPGDRRNA